VLGIKFLALSATGSRKDHFPGAASIYQSLDKLVSLPDASFSVFLRRTHFSHHPHDHAFLHFHEFSVLFHDFRGILHLPLFRIEPD